MCGPGSSSNPSSSNSFTSANCAAAIPSTYTINKSCGGNTLARTLNTNGPPSKSGQTSSVAFDICLTPKSFSAKLGDLIENEPVELSSIAHTPSPPVLHGSFGKMLLGGSNVYGLGLRGVHCLVVGLGVGYNIMGKRRLEIER